LRQCNFTIIKLGNIDTVYYYNKECHMNSKYYKSVTAIELVSPRRGFKSTETEINTKYP